MEWIELQGQNFTFIGKGNLLSGKFKLTGIIKLASHMEGQLQVDANGTLTIERNGSFHGLLHCHDLEIFGVMEGDIVATGRVVIHPSAKVKGKIETQNLCIYPGSYVNIEGHTLRPQEHKEPWNS